MNSNIVLPATDYDFSKYKLTTPINIQGGAYFTKLLNNEDEIYIQTPKCTTKNGFIKSGKRVYSDLIFDKNNETFIEWFENLEEKLQQLIYSKRENWFEEDIGKDDIETAFSPTFRTYKSGNYYLLRVMVDSPRMLQASSAISIFDEQEQVLSLEDVNSDSPIVNILQIQGVKFTDKSFQLYVQIKQVMVLKNNMFSTCQIIRGGNKDNSGIKIKESLENNVEDVQNKTESTNVTFKIETNEDINNKKDELIDIETLNENNNNNINFEITDENDIGDTKSKIKEEDTDVNEDNKDNENTEDTEENEDNLIKHDTNISSETEISVNTTPDKLEEFNMDNLDLDNMETITLRKPNEIYYEMYKQARDKAKEARNNALEAYLEAKNIKANYMLDDIESSDDELEKKWSKKVNEQSNLSI